jgi:amidase
MTATDIWQWSAVETAAAIRARQVSAVEVATAHIARLHAANPALNAVVVDLSDSALETARACDCAQAAGADLDILHGVPVTLKINIDIAGQANSNGVVGLADNIAPGDSPIAANVRAAGAVILGLTNTPEFSLRAFTDNPLHGLTLNPWDPAITCGGSSGGAAASLAAGIGAIAHGNDIGGSLRGPAHCCGLSTIKATQGRMPAFNPGAAVERPLMAQLMSTQGPLAREVADLRLGLEVMSRRDPRDTWQVPAPLVGPPVDRPIKVAVAPIPPDMQADPAVLALIRQAADHLADAGYAVAEVATPDISVAWRLWADLIATEIETLQGAQMRAMGSADFNRALDGFVKLAPILDGEGYMKTLALRARIVREWVMFLEDWPLILTPVSVKPPWGVNADLGGDDAVREIFWNDFRFTSALSVLGLPAAATPVGLVGGHPVAVQIVGQRFREDLCLDAAATIEARVGVLTHQLWARG